MTLLTQPCANPLSHAGTRDLSNPSDWDRQLAALIRQCYQIFDEFGKRPESMKAVFLAFQGVLGPYNAAEVLAGFKEWLESADRRPLPADILKICKKNKAEAEFLNKTPAQPAPAAQTNTRPQWWGMLYSDAVVAGLLPQVTTHIQAFTPKEARDFKKYIINMWGYPKDF